MKMHEIHQEQTKTALLIRPVVTSADYDAKAADEICGVKNERAVEMRPLRKNHGRIRWSVPPI